MTDENAFHIPDIPTALHWRGAPRSWNWSADNQLTIEANPRTDWFIDPQGAVNTANASGLLFETQEAGMLRAKVSVQYAATYDAGALVVYRAPDVWGKLALELSPQGKLMIVTVVTNGVSDDSNHVVISEPPVYLRLAKLAHAYAFHYSTDGAFWHLVRYFGLGAAGDAHIGFLAQSPLGEGCTATFSQISYQPQILEDIRSGL
jgi:regulation of enolase protein 1 (concanavalin A-like superfamily)